MMKYKKNTIIERENNIFVYYFNCVSLKKKFDWQNGWEFNGKIIAFCSMMIRIWFYKQQLYQT